MYQLTSDDVCLQLATAPIDPRTGNRVLYNMSWIATNNSMIGERNEEWVKREIGWFFRGSDNLQDMIPPVPKAFQNCADKDGVVNSAYGHILFGRGEHIPNAHELDSLYFRILETFLNEGPETRHAVAIISDRDIHYIATQNGRKDFICTNALNCMIDANNQLHIIAQMRSMDAVWGYRADYSMWDALMDKLVKDLRYNGMEVECGNITFQVANLHVYPRHFELLEKWSNEISEKLNRQALRSLSKKILELGNPMMDQEDPEGFDEDQYDTEEMKEN